ncbi:R3H domain protein [compost metagenome]
MEQIEHVGKTYQQALDEALDILQREPEEVEIEVLEEGPKGTKLRLVVRPEFDEAQDWLLDILDEMELDCSVGLIFDEETITFHIETEDDAGMLIGRKGQTLDALQYLLNVAYGPKIGKRLIVDVHDYRKRHHEKLVEQALDAVDRVRETGRSLRLPPMSAADRKVVHNEILAFSDMETGSQGEEPNRYVVVHLKRAGAPRRAF